MNINDWHIALFNRSTLKRLGWILVRVVIAMLCAQQGTHFIYQGF